MIYYKSGYKYQLEETAYIQTGIKPQEKITTRFITLMPNGLLIIVRGYAWNGADWPVIQTDDTVEASLYHDALYQLIRLGSLCSLWRDAADRLYRKVAIDAGMPHVRAQSHYIALKLFGEPASLIDAEPKILVAP